jgi:hypothetical protein
LDDAHEAMPKNKKSINAEFKRIQVFKVVFDVFRGRGRGKLNRTVELNFARESRVERQITSLSAIQI